MLFGVAEIRIEMFVSSTGAKRVAKKRTTSKDSVLGSKLEQLTGINGGEQFCFFC